MFNEPYFIKNVVFVSVTFDHQVNPLKNKLNVNYYDQDQEDDIDESDSFSLTEHKSTKHCDDSSNNCKQFNFIILVLSVWLQFDLDPCTYN